MGVKKAIEGIVGVQEKATIVKVLCVYVAIHSFLITTHSLFLSCVKAGITPVFSIYVAASCHCRKKLSLLPCFNVML